MSVETYFLVAINEDGTLTTYAELPENLPEIKRQSTTLDVYESAKQIVDEFDRNLLANKVVNALLSALNPPQETVQDKLKEKLKERGINPESITPVE
jgi:hypothetical protein